MHERGKKMAIKQEIMDKIGELLPYNGMNKEPVFEDMVDELIATK